MKKNITIFVLASAVTILGYFVYKKEKELRELKLILHNTELNLEYEQLTFE